MNELRWILIGFGIVLLAAIYLWGRRGNRAAASEDALLRTRPEPTMHTPESTLLRVEESSPEPADALDEMPSIEPPDPHSAPAARHAHRAARAFSLAFSALVTDLSISSSSSSLVVSMIMQVFIGIPVLKRSATLE